jgi:hypothetical protein
MALPLLGADSEPAMGGGAAATAHVADCPVPTGSLFAIVVTCLSMASSSACLGRVSLFNQKILSAAIN